MVAFWTPKDKQFLIIDDFPEMRSMMRSMLLSIGATQITQARNGDEALAALERKPIDVVLCDYNLGEGRDGQQILEEAKQRNLLPFATTFIMVTAENTTRMVMGALEYQPDDYLSKPFTKSVLQTRLRKILDKKDNFKPISDAIGKKQLKIAISHCDKQITESPKYRMELSKLKVELLVELGDYDPAIQLCEQILDERQLTWAVFLLGKIYYLQGEYEKAEQLFGEIIEQNPMFVIAYDWLAKTLEAMDRNQESQNVLMEATQRSPKSILRQRALGNISSANDDLDVCEKARKEVVNIGKYSIHRSHADYTGLAKVMIKKKASSDALKVVSKMQRQFKNNEDARFDAAVMQSVIYDKTGNRDKSAQAAQQALELFQNSPQSAGSETAIDLANMCIANKKLEGADDLLRHIVRNNHENEGVLQQLQKILEDAGQGDRATALIEQTRKEVVNINNQGVQLAREGKLGDSIELFIKAAKGMPRNEAINLNTAQSLIMSAKQGGNANQQLKLAMNYLEQARRVSGETLRYKKLVSMCHRIAAS